MTNAQIHTGLAGLYKLEAFKADTAGNEIPGTRRVVAGWFKNLITDAGLNLLGNSSQGFSFNNGGVLHSCGVGSGSTTPEVTDTALVAPVARTITRNDYSYGANGTAPYFGWTRVTYRFDIGVAAGNLSEVGIFTAPSGGTCFSRALIRDSGGNPTTVTVLPDEILDVTYELRLYPQLEDAPYSVTISGVEYSGVIRACQVTTDSIWAPTGPYNYRTAGVMINTASGQSYCYVYSGSIGAITSAPSGSTGNGSLTAASYTSGSFYRDHTLSYPTNNGNFSGGIGAVRLCTVFGVYQASFSPKIPKNATMTLTLNVRVSWGRYEP